MWRDKALKTCYEISQLKQVDQQAIASRRAMLEAIDEKFLWQQVVNEKFDDEARDSILDVLVKDSAWDISEDDPQRYAKKKEVWGSYLAIAHANTLAYSELCKHFEDADKVHNIMGLYIKSAALFYESFVEAVLQQELHGDADYLNVFSAQLTNKSHELLKKDILEAK